MKFHRNLALAILMSASVLALTGCFGSSKVTSPADNNNLTDTTPPAAPTNIHSTYDQIGNRDYLNWDASSSANVTGYEVWQYNADPTGGATGVLVGDASSNYLALPVVSSNVSLFYRVRAVGGNGLTSAYSASADISRHAWIAPPSGTPGGGRGTIDPND